MSGDQARRLAALVDHMLAVGVITRPEVAAAFRAVPRHLFLPNLPAEEVYRDEAIPTKLADGRAISSSSQPAMMAIMLEQLDLAPGQRVLEIGAGTGYNAALLGHLVGPTGRVVTLDIDDDLASAARDHLAAASSTNVQVICADGGQGYAPGAPYDRLILTAGAWDITPAWYEQLNPGGRLVLPLQLSSGPQQSIAFDRTPPLVEPRFISRSARDCGFMPLRGAFAGPEVITALGPEPGLEITTSSAPAAPAGQIYDWLTSEATSRPTGLRITEALAFGSLSQWVGLHAANLATLSIDMEPTPDGGAASLFDRCPWLYEFRGRSAVRYANGLLAADGAAFLTRRLSDRLPASDEAREQNDFALDVLGYGPAGDRLGGQLVELSLAWEAAGRPASSRLRVRVYGPDAPYDLAPGEVLVQKRCTRLVVDWPAAPVTSV